MHMDINTWSQTFVASIQNLWIGILNYLPAILGALIVLIIGLIIASLLGRLTVKLLHFTRLDHFSERIGLRRELDDMGMRFSFARLLGAIVRWFFIIATLIAVVGILGIPQLTAFLQSLVDYIPNVLAAVIILVIGLILGRWVQNIIISAMQPVRVSENARIIFGAAAKWTIFIFALMAALVQLKIATSLVQILFAGIVVMLSLGGALAFGLGGSDHAKRVLDRISAEFKDKT